MLKTRVLLFLALAIAVLSIELCKCDDDDSDDDSDEDRDDSSLRAKLEESYEEIDRSYEKKVAELYKNGGFNTEDLTYDNVGPDLHNDYYFFKFERQDFSSKKFAKPKITSAGQHPDTSGQKVPDSIYPWAVLQKSTSNPIYGIYRDTTTDRFDVKSDQHKNQYFGVYDGHHGNVSSQHVSCNIIETS